MAAAYLNRRGCDVLVRNVRAGRGEIDLIVRQGTQLVAVEVKTRLGAEPFDQFTDGKARRVRAAMRRLDPEPSRLDLVTVRLARPFIIIRWVRNAG